MTTALVVGDLQVGITREFAFSRTVLAPVRAVLPIARRAGVLPVFVRTALRPGGRDVPATNTLFTGFLELGDLFGEGGPDVEIDPTLGPEPGDVTVLKRRTSAFFGTDLDLVLRTHAVDHVVLTGVATSAMIAATAYDASDRDLAVTVLADACADADATLHRAFVDHVLPARAVAVTSTTRWAEQL